MGFKKSPWVTCWERNWLTPPASQMFSPITLSRGHSMVETEAQALSFLRGAAPYHIWLLAPLRVQLGNRQASPSPPLVDYYTVPAMGQQPGTSAPRGNGVSWLQRRTISRFCHLHHSFFRETPREWALLGGWRPQRARGVGTKGQGASWRRGPWGLQVGGGGGGLAILYLAWLEHLLRGVLAFPADLRGN